MAEPIIYSDSPLAIYLNQSVPNEFTKSRCNCNCNSNLNRTTIMTEENNDYQYNPLSQSQEHPPLLNRLQVPLIQLLNRLSSIPFLTKNPLHLMFSKLKTYLSSQSLLTRLPSLNLNFNINNNNSDQHSSSSDRLLDNSPQAEPNNADPTENQLSERLKYLICSSFLLNPGLQPDFYDSHPTPPMVSELASFDESSSSHISSLRPNLAFDFIASFRFFRPHPRLVLGLSTLLILISYHVSPRWALFSLPVIALAIFRPRTLSPYHHHFRHIDIIPHLSPQTLQLQIQSALVPEIAKLVNKSQALDLRVSRAIGAVKEIECVALGLGLSNPMPPVSRLETAAFAFAAPSAHPSTPDLSHDNLHALGVRKVLQRVLDQARHEFENTAVELETVISNSSGNEPTSSAGSSTLTALMEMYGCSRLSPQESQSNLRGSTSERARRQAWRASLHSRIPDNPSLLSAAGTNDHLNMTSTPPSSKRLSLQTPASPSHSASFESETRKHVPLSSRNSRSRSSYITPSQSHESQLRSTDSASPTEESTNRRSPGSRPVSFQVTYSPTPSSLDGRRSSLLIPVGRSPKPRPCSMSAASFRTLSSSSPISHARGSPELYPEINLTSSPIQPFQEPSSPVIERVVPYSLAALQNSFERMHLSRKRLMCCLLALDFTLFTPNTLAMWQDTLETVQGLLKTVETLGGELTAGMTVEFGPGSFETTPVARSVPNSRNSIREEPEDQSTETRDFAPPIPEAAKKDKRHGELMSQMQVMDLALRAISAKMKVCVEELEKESQGESQHGQRAISVHESIRGDLESLAREWDESRSKIRIVVEGEKIVTPGRSRLRPHSLDSNEGSLSMSSGRASSIYSTEPLTPVSEGGSVDLYGSEDNSDDGEDDSGPLLAPTTRAQSMNPPPGLEELLAGAIGPIRNKSDRRSAQIYDQPIHRLEGRNSIGLASPLSHNNTTIKPLKLSAEEQLELTRRRRESVTFTPRSRPHSLLHLPPPSSSSSPSPLHTQLINNHPTGGQGASMVTELKDVLSALKTRRASSIDVQ
ncbi:hypothetical protein MJO28_002590 [Puccinia striiformis f. sp. tritici]|uniref:Myosin-binding domain-containing protein n=2 Tax=Puccinia striiformis TaxID=27350 RepID=A0A2S4UAE0_9BASI|nr:hypothetical protein MJO28_002590 [Puccinia striiformis f. sp. tritici]POV94161.1 hypothetical protein PSTT_16995 [Puccinia striiformis]